MVDCEETRVYAEHWLEQCLLGKVSTIRNKEFRNELKNQFFKNKLKTFLQSLNEDLNFDLVSMENLIMENSEE